MLKSLSSTFYLLSNCYENLAVCVKLYFKTHMFLDQVEGFDRVIATIEEY